MGYNVGVSVGVKVGREGVHKAAGVLSYLGLAGIIRNPICAKGGGVTVFGPLDSDCGDELMTVW